MHGIVVKQFGLFVSSRVGRHGWREVTALAGAPPELPSFNKVYEDSEMLALVAAASTKLNAPVPTILEDFGAFLAPELLRVYAPLVDAAWTTLDIVEHTERVIHTVVRSRNPGASPPFLEAHRVSPREVQLIYTSPRKLCAVARGIVGGLAAHFEEPIAIREPECTHRGDARCLLSITSS